MTANYILLQVRRTFPYLTTERFPHNWAISDMVKGYIAGTRKERHRQAREEEEERKQDITNIKPKKSARASDSDDMMASCSNSGLKSTKSRKRADSDSINEVTSKDKVTSKKVSTQKTTLPSEF